jgi:hypothetical protein
VVQQALQEVKDLRVHRDLRVLKVLKVEQVLVEPAVDKGQVELVERLVRVQPVKFLEQVQITILLNLLLQEVQ